MHGIESTTFISLRCTSLRLSQSHRIDGKWLAQSHALISIARASEWALTLVHSTVQFLPICLSTSTYTTQNKEVDSFIRITFFSREREMLRYTFGRLRLAALPSVSDGQFTDDDDDCIHITWRVDSARWQDNQAWTHCNTIGHGKLPSSTVLLVLEFNEFENS